MESLSNLLLTDVSQKLTELIQLEAYKLEVDKLILKELQDGADEGKAIISNGTLSIGTFTIIDTQISPGHPVKGYAVENTSDPAVNNNNLYVAHNIAFQPQLDADIIDVVKANPIFNPVVPGESVEFNFNRNKIKSVHLLAVTGSPTYKCWLVW